MAMRQEYCNSMLSMALTRRVVDAIRSQVAAQGIEEVWIPWFPQHSSIRHIIKVFGGDPCERYRIHDKDI
jgi:hypothetical protein